MNRSNQRRNIELEREFNRRNRNNDVSSTLLLYNLEVISLLRQLNRINEMVIQQNNLSGEITNTTVPPTTETPRANTTRRRTQQNNTMYNNTMFNNNIPNNIPENRGGFYNTYNPMLIQSPLQLRNINFLRNPNNLANMFTDFWTSIPVYPTNEQIANATRNVAYNAETMSGQT